MYGDSNNKWQWILQEDLDTFLNDESGNPRFRINWTENIIMPISRMFRGNAIRTAFTNHVMPMSEAVKKRRDSMLTMMQGIGELANDIGGAGGLMLKSQFPVGDTPAETEARFPTWYTDDLVRGVNDIISVVSNMNELDAQTKEFLVDQLFCCGIGVLHDTEQNGYQKFEQIDANLFIWDVSARRQDLQDGDFMGDYWFDSSANIIDQYPDLSKENREQIDTLSRGITDAPMWLNNAYLGNITGRVRVIRAYWRDIDFQEFGIVKDEFGYEIYTRINHPNSLYTDADLIEPTLPQWIKIMKGKKKHKKPKETIHYVKCIDAGANPTAEMSADPIMLEYGEMTNAEENVFAPGKVLLPYKVATFKYFYGIPQGIVDFLIDSQRIMNRALSVKETLLNQYIPPSFLYEKTMLDPQDGGEEGFLRRLRNGKPNPVHGRNNLPNNFTIQPGTDLRGIQYINATIDSDRAAAQNSVGANQSMLGTGAQELVRNTQAMITQGSVMQEDLFSALELILKQCTQSIATRGRRLYYDNPDTLAYSISSDEVREILVSPESLNEKFFIRIERGESYLSETQKGTALALQFRQVGLLDDATLAKLINRSNEQDVYAAVTKYLSQKALADAQMAEVQQQEVLRQEARQEAQMNQGVEMQRETTAGAQAVQREKIDADVYADTLKAAAEVKKATLQANSRNVPTP